MSKRRKNSSIDYLEGAPVGAFLILLFAAWSYIKKILVHIFDHRCGGCCCIDFYKNKKKKKEKQKDVCY